MTCQRCQTTAELQRCNRCYNTLCATCIAVLNCPHELQGKHEPTKCVDCGCILHAGTAKAFVVCEECWDARAARPRSPT